MNEKNFFFEANQYYMLGIQIYVSNCWKYDMRACEQIEQMVISKKGRKYR